MYYMLLHVETGGSLPSNLAIQKHTLGVVYTSILLFGIVPRSHWLYFFSITTHATYLIDLLEERHQHFLMSSESSPLRPVNFALALPARVASAPQATALIETKNIRSHSIADALQHGHAVTRRRPVEVSHDFGISKIMVSMYFFIPDALPVLLPLSLLEMSSERSIDKIQKENP